MPSIFNNWFAGNKAEEAKINSEIASSTAKQEAQQARKSTSSAISNIARSMTQGSKALAQTAEDKTAQTAEDVSQASKDRTHSVAKTGEQNTNTAEQGVEDKTNTTTDSTQQATNSTEQAAKDRSYSAADATAQAAEDATQDTSDRLERAASNVEPSTVSTADTPVNKVKSSRPKMSSHDSVGDKFKHVLHLDHKQHRADVSTGTRSS